MAPSKRITYNKYTLVYVVYILHVEFTTINSLESLDPE